MSAVSAPTSEAKPPITFPELDLTGSSINIVVKMIQSENIVALYTETACRTFHNLKEVDLSKRRVVYLDCNSAPGILVTGEWNDYIRGKIPTVTELPLGDLRNKIIEQKDVPHKQHLTYGLVVKG